MIEVHEIVKKYGENNIVLNIEQLYIPKGQCFGLVGNNGAGKTTLFSLLLDLIQPTTGRIVSNNIQVNLSEEWKPFTSAYIDESFLIGYLTPEEYFYFIGELRGWKQNEVDEFIGGFQDFFNGEILGRKKYIRDLSKGNAKKTGIIAALIGNPQIIILDEPFANLDPTTQFRLKFILRKLLENKETTVLISSHDLQHIVEVSERIVVLDRGCIVKDIQKSEETMQELESFFKDKISLT
ncbi:ABC transporter ATP-binding protein [Membranihabitans maritimus]|uniref:ABC transporter ATP-binding protein n=1 Tax=Membranihabitans maritimus TaxID=2904244 RepID=UPI001F24B6E8|nr:ABC transporter ATP-binding protein [Membranihabitans maritimus]